MKKKTNPKNPILREGQAQLTYEFVTDPFPMQANAKGEISKMVMIMILASNHTDFPVPLQGITIRVPVGDAATDLTKNGTGIVAMATEGWELIRPVKYPEGFVRLSFKPGGANKLAAGKSITFVLSNIVVNDRAGVAQLEITEGSNNCTAGQCPTETLLLSKFPSGWGNVSFWLDPAVITRGAQTSLYWKGPEGATYTIEYISPETGRPVFLPKTGAPLLKNEGRFPDSVGPPLVPGKSTTFTLNVSYAKNNQTYRAQDQKRVEVSVPDPEITRFTANINPVDFGVSVKTIDLSWDVSNADILELEGIENVTGKKNRAVTIKDTRDFSLKATNAVQQTFIKPLTVFSIADFLLFHSFRLFNSRIMINIDFTTTETLQFYKDGTGLYTCQQILRDPKTGKNTLVMKPFESKITYSIKSDRITIKTSVGDMIVQATDMSLICEKWVNYVYLPPRSSFKYEAKLLTKNKRPGKKGGKASASTSGVKSKKKPVKQKQ